jgi:hypothetical protein
MPWTSINHHLVLKLCVMTVVLIMKKIAGQRFIWRRGLHQKTPCKAEFLLLSVS